MTEVCTDENYTHHTDNVTNFNGLSEDEGMSNDHESHKMPKSISFGNEAISISSLVIVQVKKEKVNVEPTKKSIILQNTYLPAILIISMCIIVAILQIPTILYYTDPPSADVALFDNINLESCTVS